MRSRRPAVRVQATPPAGSTDRPKDSNHRVRLTVSQTRRETPHPSSLAYEMIRFRLMPFGSDCVQTREGFGRRAAPSRVGDQSSTLYGSGSWRSAALGDELSAARGRSRHRPRSTNSRSNPPTTAPARLHREARPPNCSPTGRTQSSCLCSDRTAEAWWPQLRCRSPRGITSVYRGREHRDQAIKRTGRGYRSPTH